MNKYNNLGDYIENAMSTYADRPAYNCAGQVLTFKAFEEQSRKIACWLQSKFERGDRIVVQLPNINQFPIAALGVIRAGMVLVNTNPLYTPREMQHQFSDSGAKAIFILSNLLPNLEQIIADTDISTVVSVDIQGSSPASDLSDYEVLGFGDIMNNALVPLEKQNTEEASGDDLAVLQYTGGTTGVAKGACLTHASILSNVQQIDERLGDTLRGGEEVFVCPLPLYHIYAFTVNLIYMSGHGAMNVLIPDPRNMEAFIAQLESVEFTGMSGINTLFVGLCSMPKFRELDFSQLKLTLSGGTPLLPDVAKTWTDVTGCTITEGYGLSETSPVVMFNDPGNEEIGTIGKPLINTEIKILDAEGNALAQGQSGELAIRGPQVMTGYWQREEATKDVFTEDGFFKTGDVALEQENGNYRIVDRIKDMILVSGFNVYPTEVESVLTTHPSVLEVAVVGGVSQKTGEEVRAYVTVSDDVDEQTLIDYCSQNLTAYKVPKKITKLDALPKSTVGKILRRELRDKG